MKGRHGCGRLIAMIALSLLLGGLAGCSQSVAAYEVRPTVTAAVPAYIASSQPTSYLRPGAWRIGSVRAILTSEFPSNHIPPFDHTSTSATLAQQFYHALLALPAAPNMSGWSCPADWGALYHGFFYDYSDASRLVAIATIDSGGCGVVILPDGSQRWTAISPDFWTTFAATFNIPLSAIQDHEPRIAGPTAPASLPPSLFSAT